MIDFDKAHKIIVRGEFTDMWRWACDNARYWGIKDKPWSETIFYFMDREDALAFKLKFGIE